MTEYNGKPLSMRSDAIYKGNYTHNGTMLNIHDNSYTIGYAKMLTPDGSGYGATKFGNAVFLNGAEHSNVVYAGKPTMTGAIPVFAGIVTREPAYASSYPVKNDEVTGYQNGLLCREGFLIYKKGEVVGAVGAATESFADVELFDYVYMNFCMFADVDTGKVYFSAANTAFKKATDIMVGRVVSINPDDRSVTVKVSPVYMSNNAVVASNVAVTAGTPTADSIPVSVVSDVPASVRLEYKTGTGDYVLAKTVATMVFDSTTSKYKLDTVITGLQASTAYTVRAVVLTACGFGEATDTATTTA